MNAPTTSKLRHDLDHGRGDDKVDHLDPAAAPLGTDEEAAGTPVPPEAVAKAHRQEIGTSRASEERRGDHAVAIYVALIGAVLVIAGTSIWATGPL